MPIARVEINGRIARIEVPEGTTPEQARQMALQAINAPKPRAKSTGSGILDQALGSINETIIGGVQGLENMGRVLTDPIVRMMYGDKGLQADRQRSERRYNNASRVLSVRPQPVARTAGQIGSAIPFAGVSAPAMLGRAAPAATRAAQGAIGGAAARDTDGDAGRSMGIGAATNIALPPAIALVASTKPAQWLGNRLLGFGGKFADDLAAAGREALGFSAPPRLPMPTPSAPRPDPAQLVKLGGRQAVARAARLKAAGVERPTTGMVTRNPRAWTAEREVAKVPGVGDDLQNAYIETNQQLANRGRQIVDRQGGTIGREATGQQVGDALAARNRALADEVGDLYRGVRETVGDVRVPSLENLKAAQAHPDWADNADFDAMVAALNKRLLRYADADGGASGLSVNQSEELRKFIGGLGPNSSQG